MDVNIELNLNDAVLAMGEGRLAEAMFHLTAASIIVGYADYDHYDSCVSWFIRDCQEVVLDVQVFKASLTARRASRTKRPSVVVHVPYDSVFEHGVAWLDSLAGESIEQQEGVLSFDTRVWRAPSRTEGVKE